MLACVSGDGCVLDWTYNNERREFVIKQVCEFTVLSQHNGVDTLSLHHIIFVYGLSFGGGTHSTYYNPSAEKLKK